MAAKVVRPTPTVSRPARAYPHVTQVTDVHAQSSLRLLWDRTATLEGLVTDQAALIAELQGKHDTLLARVETTDSTLQGVQLIAAKPTSAQTLPPGQGNTPQQGTVGQQLGTPTPLTPAGQVAAIALAASSGFVAAGPTGHVTAGSPIDGNTAGLIVGGTANEWSALLAVAVDQPTRDANRAELIGRMIWHLDLAGFNAGYWAIALSPQVLLGFTLPGLPTPIFFQVTGSETYTVPMTAKMSLQIPLDTTLVPSGGIAD